MKWIKYQIVCNADKNILLNKRLEYTNANLAIAQKEAYNGAYTIEEDDKSFEVQPLAIEHGGTGAKTAADARLNLGVAATSKSQVVTVLASSWSGEGPYTTTVACSLAAANNNLVVGAGGSLTAEQMEAMVGAIIVCTAQAAGNITLTAFGEAPKINLPINVLEVG